MGELSVQIPAESLTEEMMCMIDITKTASKVALHKPEAIFYAGVAIDTWSRLLFPDSNRLPVGDIDVVTVPENLDVYRKIFDLQENQLHYASHPQYMAKTKPKNCSSTRDVDFWFWWGDQNLKLLTSYEGSVQEILLGEQVVRMMNPNALLEFYTSLAGIEPNGTKTDRPLKVNLLKGLSSEFNSVTA